MYYCESQQLVLCIKTTHSAALWKHHYHWGHYQLYMNKPVTCYTRNLKLSVIFSNLFFRFWWIKDGAALFNFEIFPVVFRGVGAAERTRTCSSLTLHLLSNTFLRVSVNSPLSLHPSVLLFLSSRLSVCVSAAGIINRPQTAVYTVWWFEQKEVSLRQKSNSLSQQKQKRLIRGDEREELGSWWGLRGNFSHTTFDAHYFPWNPTDSLVYCLCCCCFLCCVFIPKYAFEWRLFEFL